MSRAHERRVAIVTPYGLNNYGNRLQNAAVAKLLSDRGYVPETLVLRPRPMWRNNLRANFSTFIDLLGLRGQLSRRRAAFRRFDKPLIFRTVWGESQLKALSKRYSHVIVGSDQIWNPHHIDFGGAEYGSFAIHKNVFSLSASFGVGELTPVSEDLVRRYVPKYGAVSVREHAGADIIKALTGLSAQVLIDPTLAVDEEYWKSRCDPTITPDRSYIFVYLLGSRNEEHFAEVCAYAKSMNLDVVRVEGNSSKTALPAGPQHFLDLIRNARLVCTDSYHAVIFATLFQVPHFLFTREGEESMNSRFITLTQLLPISYRDSHALMPSAVKATVDQAQFNVVLNAERMRVASYLKSAVK